MSKSEIKLLKISSIEDRKSWIETHFEVVSGIQSSLLLDNNNKAIQIQEEQGTGGLYELSEELTDAFEKEHENDNWEENDFFQTIEEFLEKHLI